MKLCYKAKFVCVGIRLCTRVSETHRVQNASLSADVKSKKQQKLEIAREVVEPENPPLATSYLCFAVEESAPKASFDGQITHVANGN